MGELLGDTNKYPRKVRAAIDDKVWPIVKPLTYVVGEDPLVVLQSGTSTIIKLSQDAADALRSLTGRPTPEEPDGDFDEDITGWREVILCNDGTPETVQIYVRTPI
jgi:hypothetical protein